MKTRSGMLGVALNDFQAWELVLHFCPFGEILNDGREN
jgi:hypothetical protein